MWTVIKTNKSINKKTNGLMFYMIRLKLFFFNRNTKKTLLDPF